MTHQHHDSDHIHPSPRTSLSLLRMSAAQRLLAARSRGSVGGGMVGDRVSGTAP